MPLNIEFSSKLLENAIESFASLPGVGRRTALRLALYILRQPADNVSRFADNIIKFRQLVNRCKVCHNLCDGEVCDICKDCKRDNSIICVVKDIQDVIAIENTHQYRGTYHVLGGILSPVEGVGPADLYIDSLVKRASSDIVKEVILALNSTTDGETTKFYISQQLSTCDIKLSAISSGIAVGEELEYADEITLGRSISDRKEFK